MSVRANGGSERFARSAGDRSFTGRIHVREQDDVRVVECTREVLEECLRARVAMWLKRNDDAAIESALRSVERGFGFLRGDVRSRR